MNAHFMNFMITWRRCQTFNNMHQGNRRKNGCWWTHRTDQSCGIWYEAKISICSTSLHTKIGIGGQTALCPKWKISTSKAHVQNMLHVISLIHTKTKVLNDKLCFSGVLTHSCYNVQVKGQLAGKIWISKSEVSEMSDSDNITAWQKETT